MLGSWPYDQAPVPPSRLSRRPLMARSGRRNPKGQPAETVRPYRLYAGLSLLSSGVGRGSRPLDRATAGSCYGFGRAGERRKSPRGGVSRESPNVRLHPPAGARADGRGTQYDVERVRHPANWEHSK